MAEQPSETEIRAALSGLLASGNFRASEKRIRFLTFVVDEVLAGRSAGIKGYAIGVEVYDRGTDFDPQTDPVVRLEAGRLRRELEHYYLTDGADDEIVFDLPRGTYVASITRAQRAIGDAPVPDTPITEKTHLPPRRLVELAGVFALGLVVATLANVFVGGVANTDKTPQSQIEGESITRSTIYVTPFEPLNPDDETVALTRGLTQETVGVLANFRELEVYAVKADFTGARTPAQSGQPAYILRGTTRIVDGRVRIHAGLQDADDGRQVWSEQFDAAFIPEQVFDIQQSIATSVARKLGEPFGILRSSARYKLRDQVAPGIESYKCVLLAYEYRAGFDAQTHKQARECLQKAVQNDPDYARAWALLAYLIVDEARLFYNPLPDSTQRAIFAARQAVDLDDTDPLSFQALSVALFTAGQIEPALEAAARAVDLNPDNKEALWQLGFRKWLVGHHAEGVAIARRAIDESPSAPRWFFWVIAADLYRQGKYEDARLAAEYMRTPDLAFVEALRAAIYGQLGDSAAAARSLQGCRQLDPDFDERGQQTFAVHQMSSEMLEHLMEGMAKAGLETRP